MLHHGIWTYLPSFILMQTFLETVFGGSLGVDASGATGTAFSGLLMKSRTYCNKVDLLSDGEELLEKLVSC